MKRLLLPVLLFFAYQISAQVGLEWYNYGSFGIDNHYFNGIDFADRNLAMKHAKTLAENQIKGIQFEQSYFSKKDKVTTYTSHSKFNTAGKLLENISAKHSRTYTYEHDTLLTSIVEHSKRRLHETKMTYTLGKEATQIKFRNGKQRFARWNTYTETGKIAQRITQYKRGKKFEMRYAYNELDQLTKTTSLKGTKVKRIWIHECKPEGAIITTKLEALSSKCSFREERADGTYVKFTRSIYNGTPHLSKQTFTADSICILSEYFYKDSIPISVNSFDLKTNTSIYERYKKGKINQREIWVYNESKQVVTQQSFSGKKLKAQSSQANTYNTKNQLVEHIRKYGKKLQTTSKSTYTYNHEGMILNSEREVNGRLIWKKAYRYEH